MKALVPFVLSAISASWVSTCLPRRPAYSEIDPADFTAIVVANESTERICSVHVTVAGARRWGADQLGDREFLDPDRQRVFEVPVGSYDVRLEDCGHDPMMERRSFDVPAEGRRLTFRVREPDPQDEEDEEDERPASDASVPENPVPDAASEAPSTSPR